MQQTEQAQDKGAMSPTSPTSILRRPKMLSGVLVMTPHPVERVCLHVGADLPHYFTRPIRRPRRYHGLAKAAEVRPPSGDDYEYEPDRPYDYEFEVDDTPEFVETPLLDASGQKLWRRNREPVGFLVRHEDGGEQE